MTRWLPRRSARALRRASRVRPEAWRIFFKGGIGLFEKAEQEVFGADVFVVELGGLGGGGIEGFLQGRAEEEVGGGGAVDFGFAVNFALDSGGEDGEGSAEFFEEGGNEAVVLRQQRGQEVGGVHFLVGVGMGDLLGLLKGFRGL